MIILQNPMHLPYHIMLKREISKRKLPIYLAKKKKKIENENLGTCQ